jgi:hypothetical protein
LNLVAYEAAEYVIRGDFRGMVYAGMAVIGGAKFTKIR